MNTDTLLFFEGHMDALPLYEKLEERILSEIDNVRIKVQKSQISFYNKHMFACMSFARVRKKKDCPESYIVVTFGLEHKEESPRIDIFSGKIVAGFSITGSSNYLTDEFLQENIASLKNLSSNLSKKMGYEMF